MASSSPLRLGSSFNAHRAPVKSGVSEGDKPSRSDAERGACDERSALDRHSERGRYLLFLNSLEANERFLPPTLPSGKVGGGGLTSEAS